VVCGHKEGGVLYWWERRWEQAHPHSVSKEQDWIALFLHGPALDQAKGFPPAKDSFPPAKHG